MRISVIGCGYLGAVHAACLAAMGHDVIGIDTDPAKVRALSDGQPPFFEPGLPELLERQLRSGRLRFSTDPAAARGAAVHFICVGTPQKPGELGADMSYVDAAFENLLPHVGPRELVVGKSTVPVGTGERLATQLASIEPTACLVWNPEFLREGFAIKDTVQPDRLVYGYDAAMGAWPVKVLDRVYAAPIAEGTPRIVADLATAQMVKVAANAFLATKISFINAMAELCEATGANVSVLADAIGHDERIGRRFLNAGLGFGGGCLPKDIRAFMARAGELGVHQALSFLGEVDAINLRRRTRMVELARQECGGSLAGRRVAILGAAFKPNSDDIRDSPALAVAMQMLAEGAEVTVTDPQAVPAAQRAFPQLQYADTAQDAATDADLVMLLTEWDEYVELDPLALGKVAAQRRILDGRNALDADEWRFADWSYRALGRR